jgi:hypothetical protein
VGCFWGDWDFGCCLKLNLSVELYGNAREEFDEMAEELCMTTVWYGYVWIRSCYIMNARMDMGMGKVAMC